MVLSGKLFAPFAQEVSEDTEGTTPCVLTCASQVGGITEQCEMDFLLPEKSEEPHGGDSALPTWDSSERTVQHLFTCYWGANARKIRNRAIPPCWTESGR